MNSPALRLRPDRRALGHAAPFSASALGAALVIAVGVVVGKLAALHQDPAIQLAFGVLLPAGTILVVFFVLRHTRSGLSLLNPLMFVGLYYLLLFCVEPLLMAWSPTESAFYVRSLSFGQIAQYVAVAGILCVVSYLCTCLGFAAVSVMERSAGQGTAQATAFPAGRRRGVRPGTRLVLITLLVIGWTGMMLYSGLIPFILEEPGNRSKLLSGTGLQYTLVLAFVALPVVWMSVAEGHPRWSLYLPVCGLGLAALALFGGRAEIGTAILAAILSLIAFRRPTRRHALFIVALLAVGLLLFSAVFFAIRSQRVYREADPVQLQSRTTLTAGVRNTLSAYDHLITYLDTIGTAPANRVGEMSRVLVTGLLPSSLVGEKEGEPAQVLFDTLYDRPDRVGIPFTLPGLMHYTAGMWGVVVGSLAFGMGLRVLYRGFRKRQTDPLVVAMYAYFLARLLLLLRGSYVSAVLQLIQVELLILGVMAWSRVVAGGHRGSTQPAAGQLQGQVT